MNDKKIFSLIARLFRPFQRTGPGEPAAEEPTETKTETEKERKQAPPPIDVEKKEKEKAGPRQVKTVPRRPVEKIKKTGQFSPPKTDKKGFALLTDKHDLYQLFEGGKKKNKPGEENFAEMFEKSRTDKYQLRLLKEKKASAVKPAPTPLTVGERIKEYPPPQVDIDLHGYSAVEAEKRTAIFIRNARRKGIRTVRVIVGKGLHSNGKAVLPDVIEKKIIQLKQSRCVLGFKWEKKDKRKSGALVVYLVPSNE